MANEPVGILWLNQITQTGPSFAFKAFMVLGLVMYSFFALVVIKQVGIMTESFESDFNRVAKLCSWMHFFLSLFLLLISFVI